MDVTTRPDSKINLQSEVLPDWTVYLSCEAPNKVSKDSVAGEVGEI